MDVRPHRAALFVVMLKFHSMVHTCEISPSTDNVVPKLLKVTGVFAVGYKIYNNFSPKVKQFVIVDYFFVVTIPLGCKPFTTYILKWCHISTKHAFVG